LGEIVGKVRGIMKVLLRDAGTGSYVGREVAWVGTPEVAAEFETMEAAGYKAQEFGRHDVVVVLKYESPECELALNPAYCVTHARGGGQRPRI
jgi:hypothetical protein